ncbi:MAG: Gfo/Idh/MocA family oxidoreductase [Candidatus Dormibacteria bacterium]|jgi:predicted dehydrogenase
MNATDRPPRPSHRRRRGDRAPLRIALVGAGSMGENHARVIAQSAQVSLGAVVDSDGERADQLVARWGGTSAVDLDAALACDAAVVATTTESHVEIGRRLLEGGLPLLIEKPMATSSREVEALCALAAARGLPLMCGFVERFNAVVGTLTGSLEGDLVHVMTLRHSPAAARAGSSVVWDLLIHDIDLVLKLCGMREPVEVAAQSMVPPGGTVSELADCTLRFDGGPIATLSASRMSQRKLRSLQVTTTEAVYDVDLLRQDVTVYRHVRAEYMMAGSPRFRSETVIDIPFVRHAGEPLALQLQHFVDIVEGRADAGVEIASILPAHRTAERVATGERVGDGAPAATSAAAAP